MVASAIVILSFALFALDETRDASRRSAEGIAGLNASRTAQPSPQEERARESVHGGVREAIDDANDVLLSPFASVAPFGAGAWARRGIPALLAVMVYGFGLSFLARFARGGS